MISGSVFLVQDDPGVRRLVSKGGRGLRPPWHDEKGNDGIENITDRIKQPQKFESQKPDS